MLTGAEIVVQASEVDEENNHSNSEMLAEAAFVHDPLQEKPYTAMCKAKEKCDKNKDRLFAPPSSVPLPASTPSKMHLSCPS